MKLFAQYVFLFSLILLTCLGCNKEDDTPEPEVVIENELIINVDRAQYRSINENVGGNENCGTLFISTFFYKKDEIKIRLRFTISNDGHLEEVSYDETKQNTKRFLSPNFNPISTFNISDFYYEHTTGKLSFKYDGTLFYQWDNNLTKTISGEVNIKSFHTIECSSAERGLFYSGGDINLHNYFSRASKYTNNTQIHWFHCNNGYLFLMYLKNDLWDYPIDESINFDEDKLWDKVEIWRTVGPVVADQNHSPNNQEWDILQTKGIISLKEKYIVNGKKMIKGNIDITAIKDNAIVHDLKDIEFITVSFKD